MSLDTNKTYYSVVDADGCTVPDIQNTYGIFTTPERAQQVLKSSVHHMKQTLQHYLDKKKSFEEGTYETKYPWDNLEMVEERISWCKKRIEDLSSSVVSTLTFILGTYVRPPEVDLLDEFLTQPSI